MTDTLTRIIGAVLGCVIGIILARRIHAVATYLDEIAPWVDEPDPRTCDSDAVTAYLASPRKPT